VVPCSRSSPPPTRRVADAPTIEHVVVVKRGGNDVEMVDGRDHWYHELMETASTECPAEPMDAEQLLFILYTSGTTGKPKGIMPHHRRLPHPGHLHPQATSSTSRRTDTFWCTADVGWITGAQLHRLRSPLQRAPPSRDVRGVPNWHPGNGPLVGDHREVRVNIFYTAPTAIRAS
jgi:acetyl-CoA synthetase